MKSAVDTLSPTRVKMTIEVPYAELEPSVSAAYKTIGNQIQVPGFRQGKVPARIIDQRVGRGAVLQEAVNEALPEFYGQALESNDVQPLGQPEVEVTDVPASEGEDLKFTVEVDVRPQFDLPDFSAISVTVDPVEVTDEDVDAEIETLRERFGTLAPVERAAAEGDSLTIDLSATIGDEKIDDVSGVSYVVGSGNMLEGLDDAVTGLSAGDTATFEAALAGGEHEGQAAQCSVTVQSVKERQLPDVDDDFAQLASEHDTVEELRTDMTAQAERGKRFQQGIQARDKVLDQLLEDLDLAVPQSIVEAEVQQHLEGEDRVDDDEHRAEVTESTTKALQSQFLLDKIVEENEVQVSQEELIEYLIMSAQQYGMDPNQFAQALDQQGQVPAVMGEVARRKALSTVLERVTVVDTNGETVDLNALNDAGEDDDAEAADGTEAIEVTGDDEATDGTDSTDAVDSEDSSVEAPKA
ncbi:trigger factor [Allobranchiibius sp. GilTou38]|uniref:trigger factor n=1 Tax=Allobranchiibius sp. GilTou38 TaxID=2815210 RepID=UPI001AA0C409|nr:trigger factor [Allobranchiibius sp. GilTou38]